MPGQWPWGSECQPDKEGFSKKVYPLREDRVKMAPRGNYFLFSINYQKKPATRSGAFIFKLAFNNAVIITSYFKTGFLCHPERSEGSRSLK